MNQDLEKDNILEIKKGFTTVKPGDGEPYF